MTKLKITLVFLMFCFFVKAQVTNSNEVGITDGKLSVSLTGSANYSIPIALPPGINGVVPQIGLAYSSQSGIGIAGIGWGISGLSSITRIPSTKFHDNNIDAVNLDLSDRFALDGQRLIVRLDSPNANYGGLNTVYETENFSNVRISPFGRSQFRVEYPDGSVAIYSKSNITTWCIDYWKNPQGVQINYHYTIENNNIILSSITYGGLNSRVINEVQFIYKSKQRAEQYYIGGESIINDKFLSEIKVIGNGVGFRNYVLTYDAVLGYERLISITEKTGDNTGSYNSTIFNYAETTIGEQITTGITPTALSNGLSITNDAINGDFNGDGDPDFILPNFPSFTLFTGVNDGIANVEGNEHTVPLMPLYNLNQIFTAKILEGDAMNGYKMMNRDAWCTAGYKERGDGTLESYFYNVYSRESDTNPVKLEYTKEFTTPNDAFLGYNNFNGDFNGDGLSDIVMVPTTLSNNPPSETSKHVYFLNLDKRIVSNYVKDLGLSSEVYQVNNVINTGDVNGDGKTDLIIFKGSPVNKIFVYSLDKDDNLIKLFETSYAFEPLPEWDPSTTIRPNINSPGIISGDFNGDGKTDFILRGSTTYSQAGYVVKSNIAFFSTGISFVTEVLPQFHYLDTTLIPIDFDNDGKTDLVGYSTPSPGGIGLDSPFYIRYYKRISINNWTMYNTQTGYINRNFKLSTPLTAKPSVLSGGKPELAVFGKDSNDNFGKIYYFVNQNALTNQKLLKDITLGNGIKETITYSSLENTDGVYTNAQQGLNNYPYYDIDVLSGFKVVSQIEKKIDDIIYKKQQYKYYGGYGNIEGLGFMGFRAVSKTNWFMDNAQAITNVTKFDVNKRGAPIESFSVLGLALPTLTLSSSDAFINRSLSFYNYENTASPEATLMANKVFKLKNTFTQSFNGLEGTGTETKIDYNIYNNPIKISTDIKNATVLEQTTINSFGYDTPITTPYMIDRPKSKNTSVTIFPSNDITSSEELYTYQTNLLKQVKKKGHNTVYITEDNLYDSYGNIIKKTLSAPGLSDRVSSFVYDVATHRFLTTKTDIEGLITNYTYNSSTGLLLTETLPSSASYPITTTYTYDKWGKPIKTTSYLGKGESYVYLNSPSGIVKTTVQDDGGNIELLLDKLGRTYRKKIKNIDGSFSSTYVRYDIYDRIVYSSLPSSATPTVWNETEYDVYGRLKQSISLKSATSGGKIVNYDYPYSSLTVTESEPLKTKQSTKNAIGKVISVAETPGGTISYNYFANGNLKSTNCNGSTTTITQDGWGRKTALVDPSAGTYNYEYNNFGETTKEAVVGKGQTIYTLNAVGKVSTKIIKDAGGVNKSKNTYTYNPTTKLLTKIRFDDYAGASITNYNYGYDNFRRLNSNDETGFNANYSRATQFDAFGRPERELYSATNNSNFKKSEKWIKNTYKNGYKWQILDDNTGTVLWQTNTVNPQGQLLTAKMGNGVIISNGYDSFGFPTQIKHDKAGTNIMTLNTVFEPINGNLTSRNNNMFGTWNESFTYDNSDRLKTYKDVSGTQTQTYNDNGTILKNNIGDYAYGLPGKPFMVSTITPGNPSPALTYYTGREQNITYNLFKSPVTITEQNKENIDFDYNAFNGRATMYYGGLQTIKDLRPYRKFYSSDGIMEIKRLSATSTEFITYIGGDGYSAPIILKSNGTTQNYFYLHRDYQGTIAGITNSTGVIVEKRLFDVWGSLIKFANNAGATTVPTTSTGLFLDRGYTGHEHLLGVGLINMNGRIYDSKLHRFLQPDNNLQDPFNTQNYNRYSYGMNNPTKYTDPSGEFWQYFLASIISAYAGGVQANNGQLNPFNWNSTGWTNAALSAASYGASTGLTNYTNNFLDQYGDLQDLTRVASANNDGAGHRYVTSDGSGLNDDDNIKYNPQNKDQKWYLTDEDDEKYPSLDIPHHNIRNSFRYSFNNLETLGTSLEVGGLGLSLYTEGTSLLATGAGFVINTISTGGNTLLDIYDKRYGSSFIRLVKYGTFFGLSKGIGAASYGTTDKFLMEGSAFFYDHYISDKIIDNVSDSRTLFTPIEYEYNFQYGLIRKN